ncbi:MAG: hypothetical protein MRK01_00290 [Candidatus Scalindua sp.]|nr:hypothetical protein [Candidatus Scalindua sp.]
MSVFCSFGLKKFNERDINFFSQFQKNRTPASKSPYKFVNTQEGGSLLLTKNNRLCCYILAGRQIVTREKLEVLSIASDQNIEDGLPIEEVIKKLIDKGKKEDH